MGGTVKDFYWTIGPYDIVVLMEAPDDETATAASISSSGTSSSGNSPGKLRPATIF